MFKAPPPLLAAPPMRRRRIARSSAACCFCGGVKSFLRDSCSRLPIFHKNAFFCRRQKKEDSDKNVPEKEYRNVVIYAADPLTHHAPSRRRLPALPPHRTAAFFAPPQLQRPQAVSRSCSARWRSSSRMLSLQVLCAGA